MTILFTAETLVYYICLIVISVRIFDGALRKLSIALSFFIYIPVVVIGLTTSVQIFTVFIFLTFAFEITVLRLSVKNVRLGSIVYSFLFLFCLNLVVTSMLIAFLPPAENISIIVEVVVHLVMVICCTVICYTKAYEKIKNIIFWTPKGVKYILIFLIVISSATTVLILDIENFTQYESTVTFVIRLIMLLIMLVCATFPILILNSTNNTYLKRLTSVYEEQIKAQAEHYEALSRSNMELRRFRHDLKNIRIGVGELIKEQRYEEALEMLDVSQGTSTDFLMFDTGNGIVDALLTDKQHKAEASNIKISFKGALPSKLISPTDLCIIFGNTIDNAIEACQSLPNEIERLITVSCNCSNGFVFVKVTNPVSERIELNGRLPATTKKDKALHGFGLSSLDKVVRSHNGEIDLHCSESGFDINIEFNLPKAG